MFAARRGDSLFGKKGYKERPAAYAGDAEPESLIPVVRSWTVDAMPELAPALPPQPLAPPLGLTAFFMCVAGAAALADCSMFATLFKRRFKNGLFSIIIQIAIADIILLGTTAGPELWSLNSRTWHFGANGCIAYQGLSVFTSTLSVYLLIALTLHTLTTITLEEKTSEQSRKRCSRDADEEIRSSQHSLVANSDSSTPPRTMNVDYRVADIRVPVTMPTMFLWILALSLSVPEFALATITSVGKNLTICSLDTSHQYNVHSMLTVFNLFLPLFLISITSAFVIVKLKSKRKVLAGALDSSESVASLKLSLCLMCVYLICCAPRSVVNAYRVYSSSISGYESPLECSLHSDTVAMINLTLSCAYLTATLIRPLLCIITLPQLRKFFVFNARISNV